MSEPVISVRDLSVVFGHDESATEAVSHIDFDLNAGETLALVGESGSGKSVTALSLLQLLPYPLASHPNGSIVYKGEELLGASEATMRRIRGDRIGMIFQEPMTSLNPLHSIEKQINEVLLIHKGMSNEDAHTRTLELLDLVGLDDFESRLNAYPHQLSGGQRQRVMIAMALANEPDVLIADEPTTALDVTIQAQILDLLRSLQQRLGLSVLLITHDLTVVQNVAHRVCVMQNGTIVERGDAREVFESPQHPYTRELVEAEPAGHNDQVDPAAETVLAATDLRVWFPIRRGLFRRVVDHVKAVDGVSLTVKSGQTIGIVGESGSGKSTLAFALLKLLPYQGSVAFLGSSIDQIDKSAMRDLRQNMQIVFQDPYGSLSPRMSISQIVMEGLKAHGLEGSETENDALVVEALESVELDSDTRFRYPHEFSGGQRQRIALARVMVLKPRLIILDEPTSALDRSVQVQMVNLLRQLQKNHQLSYLFISHDLRVVRAMANDIMVLQNGKMVEQGTTRQIFESPQQDYTRELIKASLTSGLG